MNHENYGSNIQHLRSHNKYGLANVQHMMDSWVDENVSVGVFIFTFLAVVAISYGTGRHPGYELLFFAKRLSLHAKEMAYRLSTGLIKPSVIVHGEEEKAASGTTVGSIQAKTGLSSLATRMAQKKPVGLGNSDFSCYQNSVIQGLASLESLPEYLVDITNRKAPSDAPASAILRTTLDTLNTPQDRRMIMLPKVLKSMSSIEQQDAQEYFSKLMDQVDKEYLSKVMEENGEKAQSASSSATKFVSKNPLEGLIAQRVGCLQCRHSDGLSLIPFNNLTLPLSPYSACHLSECLDEYTKLEDIEDVECPKCTLLQTEAQLLKMKGNPHLIERVGPRLEAIRKTLVDGDFSDKSLAGKCGLPKKFWKTTTKSKQISIIQPPKCLVVHTNRSVFDETTGDLYKNHSNVRFPTELDLGPWCIDSVSDQMPETEDGKPLSHQKLPSAIADPRYSMLPPRSNYPSQRIKPSQWQYDLRAAVIHHGRHENGHYICYRKYLRPRNHKQQSSSFPGWWELSDDDVQEADEMEVLQQGQVFMLFYELVSSSQGEEEAILRIASRTPLPVETKSGDEFPDGTVVGRDVELNSPDDSSESSSSDDLVMANPSGKDHQAAATPPRMSTGIITTDDRSDAFSKTTLPVNVV